MKLLIPQNTIMLSSNIPEDDAPMFTNRNYTAGERVIYDKAVYERTVGSTSYAAFANTTEYKINDYVTYSAVNYICKLGTSNPTPPSDTSRWVSVTPASWAVNTAYSVGNAVLFTGYGQNDIYVCTVAHTSVSTIPATWTAGVAYSSGTIVVYKDKFYSILWNITSNSAYPPDSKGLLYNPYNAITTVKVPHPTSTFWVKVPKEGWNNKTFYKSGEHTHYSNVLYKATSDITASVPSSDTARWEVVTTKDPASDIQSWKRLSTTNRWKMFDQFLNTYSNNLNSIEILVSAFGFNTIYLGNISAHTVLIEVIDNSNSQVIETKTIDLMRQPLDWKDYFYGDWVYNTVNYIIFERSSLTSDVNIRATVSNSGYANIGTILIGKNSELGHTKFDFKASALDFSTVFTDTATGETYLNKGNYVNLLNADVFVSTSNADSVYKVITRIQGTPVLFYDLYETTTVYGFIRKFEQVYRSPVETLLNLDIQGLI